MTVLFQVLRIAAALCFIGHGAFGIITKESWLAYFAVVGIGREGGYFFMPLVGAMDIFLGLSVLLRPTKAALGYMTLWALWTASLRPLAGQGFPEFLERAGNYGVPFALLLIGLAAFPRQGWFAELTPAPLDGRQIERIAWVLRATTATLLLGHGLLAVAGKPLLVKHLAAIGIGDGGASTAAVVAVQGWLEIGLAAAVLALPAWPLLLLAVAWKLGSELLFPLTGDYAWEFVERAGSYGAPLGLLVLGRALQVGAPRRPWPMLARSWRISTHGRLQRWTRASLSSATRFGRAPSRNARKHLGRGLPHRRRGLVHVHLPQRGRDLRLRARRSAGPFHDRRAAG